MGAVGVYAVGQMSVARLVVTRGSAGFGRWWLWGVQGVVWGNEAVGGMVVGWSNIVILAALKSVAGACGLVMYGNGHVWTWSRLEMVVYGHGHVRKWSFMEMVRYGNVHVRKWSGMETGLVVYGIAWKVERARIEGRG